MKIFYYVHTGHRIGLDRFRRAVAILNAIKDEFDITLLCSDFRIAQIAKDFGIDKAVGIDVVRNIPQITHYRDKLIFDSDEANPIMLEDMKIYFSTFIQIKSNDVFIDAKYFEKEEKSIKISYFFGDDDYEKDLEKNLSFVEDLNPHLQLGFYYFLDYEDILKEKFPNYFEFEDYDEMIKKTDILITASPQAVLENLASGGRPIYIKREDYTLDFDELFTNLNIPIIKNYNKKQLLSVLESLEKINYTQVAQNSNKLDKLIKETLIL